MLNNYDDQMLANMLDDQSEDAANLVHQEDDNGELDIQEDEGEDLGQLASLLDDLGNTDVAEKLKHIQNVSRASEEEDQLEFQNQYSNRKKDNRTQWQMEFPWDKEVEVANQVIFGN